MSAAAKDVSALQTGTLPGFDAVAGPAMAAMVLPTAMMMGGFVAMCGVGFAFARALASTGREEAGAAPAPAVPRLVVSNPPPTVALSAVEAAKPAPAKPSGAPPKPTTPGGSPPKPKAAKAASAKKSPAVTLVEAAKPAPAKPTGIPPKPSTPGGTPPKPKAAKAVSAKDAPVAPKVAAVKAPVAEVPAALPVEAAKPAPAKPTGIPPKPSMPGGTPPKPKSAAVAKTEATAAAPVTKKVVPKATKAPTIAKTSTAKGISLPKLSIQKAPGSEPGKN